MGLAFGLFILVAVWDFLSGGEEVWINYENPDNPNVLGEYESQSACSKKIESHSGPSGCRRTDGPYGAMNAIGDKVL